MIDDSTSVDTPSRALKHRSSSMLKWIFLGLLTLSVVFALVIEHSLGDPLRQLEKDNPPRDESGRKVYILLIDSLALDNLDHLPTLQRIGMHGFSAPVQPCVDNFTSACVREALSGRPVFSLFSMLENFQVIPSTAKHDFLRDCKKAGLTTAIVSRGDLRSWSRLVDNDIRATATEDKVLREVELGLQAIHQNDVVLHHWIWHDVISHRFHKGTKTYRKSLSKLNLLVSLLDDGLPANTDLIVMGDHGHTKRGRHIQGLDTPTFVAVRSPNVSVLSLEKRIPIAAVRYLLAGVTGVGSYQSQLEPEWTGWLAPHIGAELRNAGSSIKNVSDEAVVTPILVALHMALVGGFILGWKPALLMFVWLSLLGLSYPEWVTYSQFKEYRFNIMKISWLFPVVGTAIYWWRYRSPAAAWYGSVMASIVLLCGLWPGLYTNGVLRNIPFVVAAPFAGLVLFQWFQVSKDDQKKRTLLVLSIIACFVLLVQLCAFNNNVFRVRKFPYQGFVLGFRDYFPVVIGLLSMLLYRVFDRSMVWMLVAGGSAVLGLYAHKYMHAISFLVILGLLWRGSERWHQRSLILFILFSCGYAFAPFREIGILSIALIFSFTSKQLLRPALTNGVHKSTVHWGLALLWLMAAYLGLAWTIKLSIAGINFNFAIQWVEGTWHKKLWWLIAAATLLSAFFPVLLGLGVVGKSTALSTSLRLAVRLALLRFIATILFTTMWVFRISHDAASMRLRALLQDSFGWLIIALILWFLSFQWKKVDSSSLER